MYDFDMIALLKAFDDDPAKLADAFTDQLNKAIEVKRKENELHKMADEVCFSWNTFVLEYCKMNNIPDAERYSFTNGADVIGVLEIILQSVPELEKYLNILEKANDASEKFIKKANEVSGKTLDDFQKTMKDFFEKYNI